jgi:IS4 transposase
LDLRGPIPTMISITEGKEVDMTILDELVLEPGAFYVMDRGYLDFERLYWFERVGAYFVTRAKTTLRFRRVRSRKVPKGMGVRSDQVIRLVWRKSAERYRRGLRRIHYKDPETGNVLVFLTNNFDLPALTIAHLYKCRWQVELFFKWVKQNLRIKHFYGTSPNAVKTQVWIAICVYVLVAIVRKEFGLEASLSQILQILSVNVFEQMPLAELIAKTGPQNEMTDCSKQLMLNGF